MWWPALLALSLLLAGIVSARAQDLSAGIAELCPAVSIGADETNPSFACEGGIRIRIDGIAPKSTLAIEGLGVDDMSRRVAGLAVRSMLTGDHWSLAKFYIESRGARIRPGETVDQQFGNILVTISATEAGLVRLRMAPLTALHPAR